MGGLEGVAASGFDDSSSRVYHFRRDVPGNPRRDSMSLRMPSLGGDRSRPERRSVSLKLVGSAQLCQFGVMDLFSRAVFCLLTWFPWFYFVDVLDGRPELMLAPLAGGIVTLCVPTRYALHSAILQIALFVGVSVALLSCGAIVEYWLGISVSALSLMLQVVTPIAEERRRRQLALELGRALPEPVVLNDSANLTADGSSSESSVESGS